MCPQAWKEAKVIPLPKNSKAPVAASYNRPISLLPVLSKLMERIVFDQIHLTFNHLADSYPERLAVVSGYLICTGFPVEIEPTTLALQVPTEAHNIISENKLSSEFQI
jgi:hypothetical protein